MKNVKIAEGRFNHYGQRVFYLANSAEGAAYESLEKPGDVWIQKFRIKKAINILDLTVDPVREEIQSSNLLNFGLLFGEFLSVPVERNEGWKPDYFIPRFIADCAKKAGFNGIKYRSSRYRKQNLILFIWQDDEIEPIDNPYKFKIEKILPKYGSIIWDNLSSVPDAFINEQLEKFDKKHYETLNPYIHPVFPELEDSSN